MCFDGIFSCRDAIKNALCVLLKRSIFELELEGPKGRQNLIAIFGGILFVLDGWLRFYIVL